MNKVFTNQKDRKIKVIDKYNVHFLDIDKIGYIECRGYISIIYTDDGKKLSVAKLLKNFEEELSEFGFIRINRSHLVQRSLNNLTF